MPRLTLRRWYDLARYWMARLQLDRAPVTQFPHGGAYVCPHCDRTFVDHYLRNVHEWREHPGCPEHRVEIFHEWVTTDRSAFHSCRCRPEDCERGCWPGAPFRRQPVRS